MKYVEAYDIATDRYVCIGWIGQRTAFVTYGEGKLRHNALSKMEQYLLGNVGPEAVKVFDTSKQNFSV